MTRKEFIKRIDKVFDYMERCKYLGHTCILVEELFGDVGRRTYSKFIRIFTETIFSQLIIDPKTARGDEQRSYLRMLLLQSFKEEVLSTKKYLEF